MIFTVWSFIGLLVAASADPCDGSACAASSQSLLAKKVEVYPASSPSLLEDWATEAPLNFTAANESQNHTESVEDLIAKNLANDMKDINRLPDMENTSNNSESSREHHGFGELTKNLEFMMLKLAQLETIAELQQAEIKGLKEENQAIKTEIQALKGNSSDPTVSAAQLKAKEAEKVKEAQEVFKKVVQKHLHQRLKRNFVTPHSSHSSHSSHSHSAPPKKQHRAQSHHTHQAEQNRSKAGEVLLQRAKHRSEGELQSVDSSVSSKGIPIVDDIADAAEGAWDATSSAVTSGTGLVGDALSDAYNQAADQVAFVANTVIDTVEMAINILINGFTDWDAGCPGTTWPTMSVDSNGLSVDWGRQNCFIRLMGQSITIMDFDFGDLSLTWPEPIKTVTKYGLKPIEAIVDIGRELVNCVTSGGVEEVFKCFGSKLLNVVPPLNFLSRIGDLIQEFIEVFAHLAAAVINTVLRDTSSLVQQAVNSSFPSVGAPPTIHHTGKNMLVKTHSQRRPKSLKSSKSSKVKAGTNLVQTAGDDDDDSDGAITFEIHDNEGNYATKLITQFAGQEIDTSSCLAFAPKTRTGSNNKVTQNDWQAPSYDDFIQLEPWAVPCDNDWMQANPEKWEGYSFYSWESAIEKCVTVTYSMATQPVLAFVGGLEFDMLPAPLTEMETTVCWPDKQPGGVDLSVLRTVIKSGGVQLFSRTLRLVKRFGSNTDFDQGKVFPAHETWRNPAGVARGPHGVEDDRSLQPMDRASSLLQNASSPKHSSKRAQRKQRKDVKEDPESLEWSEEEIYLASMDYDRYMDTNVKSELRGVDAREHLDFLQKAKSREAAGQCQIMGLGHCSTPFYSSSAWELASQSDGTKGFDTTEYQGWVQAAWAKCLAKDAGVTFVSVWIDAGYRCFKTATCDVVMDAYSRTWECPSSGSDAASDPKDFELFGFKNPGLVSFEIKGILNNNDLQLTMQVNFGPFSSPVKRITLVNIVDHFRLVLTAMPFVSVDTRLKALKALEDFSTTDVPSIPPAPSAPIVGEKKVSRVWDSKQNNGLDYLRFPLRGSDGKFTKLWEQLLANDMTWEVMMRFIETPPEQTAIMATYEFNNDRYTTSNRRRSIGLYVRPDGNHFISSTGFGTTGANAPNLFGGNFHHIVFVLSRSTSKARYYIDGTLIAEMDYTPGLENIGFDGSLVIGGGHLNRLMEVEISRFAIWSRAWTATDVAAAPQCTTNDDGLQALYTLDGGYEDFFEQQLDLQRGRNVGEFKDCSYCQHCPVYASSGLTVR